MIQPKRRFSFTCRRVGCLLLLLPEALLVIFVLFVSVLSPPLPPITPQSLPVDFMKGVSYEAWKPGEFSSAASDQTLREIVVPSGANWIAVIVKCFQDSTTATEIHCTGDPRNSSDDDLRHVIRQAHALGLKVMLKPHLDPLGMVNSNDGRFNIGFGSDESAWAAWFASYTRFITHYAALAQELGVEYFVVGTELGGTVARTDDWRAVVQAVRAVYSGKLTYAALTYFEPLKIAWWDDLDAIGIDAYFSVTLTDKPTLAQMRLGWLPTTAYLGWLAGHWHKPLIITEVGYLSINATNIFPGNWSMGGATDLQEQAESYEALFLAFQGKPWWRGVFWWSLSTNPNQGGSTDRGYTFHNKPAEAVLRRYFGAVP